MKQDRGAAEPLPPTTGHCPQQRGITDDHDQTEILDQPAQLAGRGLPCSPRGSCPGSADQMATADLCRSSPWGRGDQDLHRPVQQIAQGQMEIELFYADQLVPTGELFRAMQKGTIDAVQSDDDSMASPTEVTVFGGYFPLGLRYSLDVPALFNNWGLDEIWKEEYAKVGVKHISAGSWDPCNFATHKPITSSKT